MAPSIGSECLRFVIPWCVGLQAEAAAISRSRWAALSKDLLVLEKPHEDPEEVQAIADVGGYQKLWMDMSRDLELTEKPGGPSPAAKVRHSFFAHPAWTHGIQKPGGRWLLRF